MPFKAGSQKLLATGLETETGFASFFDTRKEEHPKEADYGR